MTGLLVSVRDRGEARAALAGGADLIDIKEPHRGSLGAADPATWREILAEIGDSRPVSVALGELSEPGAVQRAKAASGAVYAKVGLAGCAKIADWPVRWRAVRESLPAQVVPVAVYYADWLNADAPDLDQVVVEGVRLGCQVLLVDTFDKSRGSLTGRFAPAEIERWVAMARRNEMRVVIGGSLDGEQFGDILAHQPDYLAVRGAACDGPRTGRVTESRVRQLKERLQRVAI